MKKVGRSVGRSNPVGIARQVLEHHRIRAAIFRETGRLIRREMKSLCSKTTPSQLRKVTPESLNSFSWKEISKELADRSPTFYHFLLECLMRKRCQAKGKSKPIDDDTVASLCAGIILRHCNSRMTPIPRIISLL